MKALPFDASLIKVTRIGQGVRRRRLTTDKARRAWYGMHRTARLAKLGGTQ